MLPLSTHSRAFQTVPFVPNHDAGMFLCFWSNFFRFLLPLSHPVWKHVMKWNEDISRPETPCEIIFEKLNVAFGENPCFLQPFLSLTSRWQYIKACVVGLGLQAVNTNMCMISPTLRERRGHRDLYSVQTAEVTAGVQSHNPSCITWNEEEKQSIYSFSLQSLTRCFSEERSFISTISIFPQGFRLNI